MIRVHHLNNSRSQRILWLLEELGLPYEIVKYQRDAVTNLAPPELEAVHPLGKSPMLELDGEILIESGAIIEILINRLGSGRLAPAEGTRAHDEYLVWLHYGEGSAMLPLMLQLYTGRLGEGAAPLKPRIDSEIARHLGYVESCLVGKEWLVGGELTGADIQMSFVGEIAHVFGLLPNYPAMAEWVKRCHARPAWQTALAKGGTYSFA
ncbi:glutathione S-transferase family protein [Sandaracinobacteroides hominis]|uniref:glutathione S-transferase family protein n=1 Tax=Sandaracinobacteroides hominis TaxID=2780086 RepID=UPI0018F7405D|nr:glutathione S-transferase [Sandaracinobacteroides hominis]